MTGSAGKEFHHFDIASVMVEERRAVHDQPVRELLQSEQDERNEPRLNRKQWKTSGRCEEIARQAGRWSELTGLRSQDRRCTRHCGSSHCGSSHVVPFCVVCLCPDRESGDLLLRIRWGFKRRRGRVTWPVMCGKRSFWQGRSLLTVARSRFTATARRRMFGRDRSVAGARRGSRQCCKPNTCKRCQRKVDAAGRHHLR